MRLSLTVVIGAALIAASAIVEPAPSSGPASADAQAVRPDSPAAVAAPSTSIGSQQQPPAQHYVDLNRASRKELMTLPGIDAADAGRIIANRPYLTKTELVTKNVLPTGPFLSLRHLVVAMPTTVSKGGR